jgi:hypothetical protein
MHLNVRSLPDKVNKLQLLLTDLNDNDIQFDLILICETFLTETNKNMYNISGYTFVGKNRKHAKCGGVGMFIREGLSFKIRDDLSICVEQEFESIFIEIQNEKQNVVIGEIYRCHISIQRYDEILSK